MNIQEILHGCEVGRVQRAGLMTVIGLLSEVEDSRFGRPDTTLIGTKDYGEVEITDKNPPDQVTITPFGATFIVDQRAQSHAIPHVVMTKGGQKKRVTTAACVQERQGGLISSQAVDLKLLPFSLRQSALSTRKVSKSMRSNSYEKLWESIRQFNTTVGLPDQGHLEHLYGQYKRELDEFIAPFEIEPRMIGAIVLVDGKLVGVEKAPNHEYWKAIFRPLIRETYGSYCLQQIKSMGSDPNYPKGKVHLNPNVNSLDGLEAEFDRAEKLEQENARKVVRNLLKDPFKTEVDEQNHGLQVLTLTNKQLFGQVITEGPKVPYASLCVTDNWVRNGEYLSKEKFKI
jgi:hypothetical protein